MFLKFYNFWWIFAIYIYTYTYIHGKIPRDVKLMHWLDHFIMLQITYSQELPMIFNKFIEYSNINTTLYKT